MNEKNIYLILIPYLKDMYVKKLNGYLDKLIYFSKKYLQYRFIKQKVTIMDGIKYHQYL